MSDKNVLKKLRKYMLLFGIGMGLVFPVYANLFVEWKEGLFLFFALGCLVAGIVVGVSCYLLVNFIFTKHVIQVAGDISRTAEMITTVAGSLQESNQLVSSGTMEQSASLERTSSTLKKISQMTDENAGRSQDAQSRTDHVRIEAGRGDEAMQKMVEAINRIKESADKTAEIVRTIDSIAFQTNLLSLNAAVEAAHAGDMGRGFAAVADEVHNMSRRSVEAAQKAARLIDESRKNSEDGVKTLEEARQNLGKITSAVLETSEMIRTLASSSNEQAGGITEIDRALDRISGITSQTSTSTGKADDLCRDLNAQADSLAGITARLNAMVGMS